MPVSPVAPVPAETENRRVLLTQATDPNEELLRPLSQVSI